MPLIISKIFSLSTLALVTALTLSAIAAWYSILGLTAIFAAAVIPVIIMGLSLELGKVVTTVWLHRYWDRAGFALKAYLLPAVLVLAMITSMGIFGFLSKAHIEQGVTTSDAGSQVAIIDERIKTYRENIDSQRVNIDTARNAVKLLDEQVTARIGMGFDDGTGAERAVQIRRQQRAEREALAKEITEAQNEIQRLNTEISKLNEERIPLAANLRKIEAEVGPIKYIAALIYGDNPDQNTLERAVRWVIILLVIVFDPLALVLIMAALSSYRWEFSGRDSFNSIAPIAHNSPYPPLVEEKKEIVEPTASDTNLTADSGNTEEKQDIPVKKKLIILKGKGIPLDLKKLDLIRIRAVSALRNLKDKLLIKNLSKNLKNQFSWKNLTDWNKSPTLNLLKKSFMNLKRLKKK